MQVVYNMEPRRWMVSYEPPTHVFTDGAPASPRHKAPPRSWQGLGAQGRPGWDEPKLLQSGLCGLPSPTSYAEQCAFTSRITIWPGMRWRKGIARSELARSTSPSARDMKAPLERVVGTGACLLHRTAGAPLLA